MKHVRLIAVPLIGIALCGGQQSAAASGTVHLQSVALRLTDFHTDPYRVAQQQYNPDTHMFVQDFTTPRPEAPGGHDVEVTVSSYKTLSAAKYMVNDQLIYPGTAWKPAFIGEQEQGARDVHGAQATYDLRFRRGTTVVEVAVQGLAGNLQPSISAGYARLLDKRLKQASH